MTPAEFEDTEAGQLRRELATMREQLQELNKIGMALTTERDPDRLLELILTQARRLTTSDAGSLYLVEEAENGGEPRLRFRLAQNDSLGDLPVPNFTLPFDESSIAGSAATTLEPLILDDAYEIPESATYSFNRVFDEKFGYRAKSMLVVPMMDHQRTVVGVLQLINRKSDSRAVIRDDDTASEFVLAYTEHEVEIVQSLAGQAAVSIENQRLYRDIESLFNGFVKAAVTAMEQRDPTTSGHSVRVTELTCDLAQIVHAQSEGPFKDIVFSAEEMQQLRYAGLLHDFGKVGVPEEVLVKMKKLPPVMLVGLKARFQLIKQAVLAEHLERKANHILEFGRDGWAEKAEEFEAERDAQLAQVDRFYEAVLEANEPRVLAESAADILQDIAAATFTLADGTERAYISEEELHFLSIGRGTLDEAERKQIESHVQLSYDFLIHIPWTKELARVAEIVEAHHEKLNGKGYPHGINEEDIPFEARIMTVCDIFDALTASDRPYKKAMPVDRALSILQMEADDGALDPDLVKLFTESEVYRKVLDTDWREL